jgi:hypothetical protein
MSHELTTIDFHGATLLARPGDTPETTIIAMRPVVEGMGLDWSTQLRKITRHPVLGPSVVKMTTVAADGKTREMEGLPLTKLNFWMATINARKVVPELGVRVVSYQTECADVLFAHFFNRAVVTQANGDLSANNRRVIGGIAKGVVHKAIEPLEAAVAKLSVAVERLAAGAVPHVPTAEFKPMQRILVELGVPATLSQRCSAWLRRWLFLNGHGAAIRISHETGRYLFRVDAVGEWLNVEGRKLIAEAAR